MPLEGADREYVLQIQQAAKGCISGTLKEWPLLQEALRKFGRPLSDTTPADEVRRVCHSIMMHIEHIM